MKRFRNLIFATAMFSLAWACIGGQLMAQQTDQAERYAQLHRTAQLEGMVPVIVTLDVPQIDTFTRAAARYKSVVSSFSYQVARYLTDAVLSDQIATTAEAVQSRLASKPHRIRQQYRSLPFMAMEVSAEALAELAAIPEVVGISRDREHLPILNNTVNIIRASNAWNDGYTGNGWFVAILDTGILKTHEMFTGKTIVEACFARGTDGTPDCPDGSGSMTGNGAAAHHPSTYDGWDHGTHVSGIAAGLSNSLSGVARDADVLSIQVFSRRDSGCSGGGRYRYHRRFR